MFGWEFPPYNSGGLGVACYGLTQALAKQNIDITFVLPKKLDVTANFLQFVFADLPQIKMISVDSPLTAYVTSDIYTKDRYISTKAIYGQTLIEEVMRYGIAAGEIAKKEHFDVIHAHDWLAFMAGQHAHNVSKKPLITHVHATEFERTGGHGIGGHIFQIEKNGMENSQRIITVSSLTKNIVEEKYNIPDEKIKVVHNGINANEYTKEDTQGLQKLKDLGYAVVLFVGRITVSKGPDYLLKAAKKALQYNSKIIFVFAGSGDMEKTIIVEAAKEGIANKILFAGFVRGKELAQLYQIADLCIMPSVMEPFGLVALESAIYETPVLISKQSGVGEVLTHALKTDFWDVDDIADKILAVTTYGSLHTVLGKNAKKQAEGCTWENAANKTIQIYNEVTK